MFEATTFLPRFRCAQRRMKRYPTLGSLEARCGYGHLRETIIVVNEGKGIEQLRLASIGGAAAL